VCGTLKKTISKDNKLRLKSEFDYVRRDGVKYVGKYMLLVSAPSIDGKLRCGVICGKKYSNLAVKRNRARRLLWESFRLVKDQIKTAHLVMIPRWRMVSAKRQEIQQEMMFLAKKAGLKVESSDT
jgi:ribonuclease P protein component